MSELGIEPTYIGKNEKLKFIVPAELFRMRLQSSSSDKIDPEVSKTYNKYIQDTFTGFQEARKTKYGNENNNKTKTTPEFGPRQRWAIISTDAEIPNLEKNDLKALEDYCKECGACVRSCKGGAAYETPIYHDDSPVITHIDRSKCIDSLINNNYCSYCLKVCPQGIPKK